MALPRRLTDISLNRKKNHALVQVYKNLNKKSWKVVNSIIILQKSASSSANILNFQKEVINELSFSSEIYPTLLKTKIIIPIYKSIIILSNIDKILEKSNT